jgi:hypothetical protein
MNELASVNRLVSVFVDCDVYSALRRSVSAGDAPGIRLALFVDLELVDWAAFRWKIGAGKYMFVYDREPPLTPGFVDRFLSGPENLWIADL